jgi:serine/threonine-protein kinase
MKAGDTLGGKYKLIQRLGTGGMGVVWEANHELTGRKVALKLILDPTDDLRVRLRREARACGSLNHPNIVEVYDVSETAEGDPFLVMQFLPGQTLGDLLKKKRRIEPPELAARIARDIASALEAAHGAHIIHRDLKPANIFLRQDSPTNEDAFTVKVLDFGVSKFLSGDEGPATSTGMAAGSPAYMSPEQVRIEKGLDHRTDIWSLGIVLYEMLTGVRPFTGKSVEDMVYQVITAPIPSVLSRVRTVPPALDAIVMRCLERDRDKRMPDAKALVKALDAIAESSVSRVLVNLMPPPSLSPARSSVPSTSEGRPSASSMLDSSPTSVMRQSGAAAGAGPTSSEEEARTQLYKSSAAGNPPAGRQLEHLGSSADGPLPASPNETVMLSPTDEIASPMPAWRLEMEQALAGGRPISETRGASSVDPLEQGGTLAIPVGAMPHVAASLGREPGVTTTTAPTITHAGSDGQTRAPTSEASQRKRKRSSGAWLYAAVGVGLASIVSLVAVAVFGFSSRGGPSDASRAASSSTEQTPAPMQTASSPVTDMSAKGAAPTPKQEPAPPSPAPSGMITAPTSTATAAPTPDQTGSHPAPSPGDAGNSVSPQTKPNGLPTCSRFVKLHCRNPTK